MTPSEMGVPIPTNDKSFFLKGGFCTAEKNPLFMADKNPYFCTVDKNPSFCTTETPLLYFKWSDVCIFKIITSGDYIYGRWTPPPIRRRGLLQSVFHTIGIEHDIQKKNPEAPIKDVVAGKNTSARGSFLLCFIGGRGSHPNNFYLKLAF